MRISSRKIDVGYEPELTLTSMIDVVFLLLIFFIATASFVRTERELNSSIRFQAAKAAQVNTDLEQAVVYVTADPESGARYRVGSRIMTSPDELRVFLAANYRNAPSGAFVYVEKGVPFHWVAAAIHACQAADLGGVSYVPL
jgi:biopolymer transport protein ExbD